MKKTQKDRFVVMAECYDNMAQILVPKYDFLQNEIFNIIKFPIDKELIAIDLGGGSGIFIEKILTKFPNSKCIWIDFSEGFKEVAQNRLKRFSKRIIFLLSQLESNWHNKLDCRPDLIVSMSAIHHLETEEKKQLYKKCYDFLKPEGWFFNIDEMKTIFNNSYKNSLYFWDDHVKAQKNQIEERKIKYYEEWVKHFERWKERNIINFGAPKEKGDDIHESFLDHLKWFNELGFKNSDIFIKYHLWSLIGGQK